MATNSQLVAVNHHVEQLPDQRQFHPRAFFQPFQLARFRLDPFGKRLLFLPILVKIPLQGLDRGVVRPAGRWYAEVGAHLSVLFYV